MDEIRIEGIEITPLKRIPHPLGDILHGLRKEESSFIGFGEAYFSTIKNGAIKAWKKHLKMTLNLIVPMGKVKFVFFDDRENSVTKGVFKEIILSSEGNYARLTVSPDIWFGFQGLEPSDSLVLNIASIPHDPDEVKRAGTDEIVYSW